MIIDEALREKKLVYKYIYQYAENLRHNSFFELSKKYYINCISYEKNDKRNYYGLLYAEVKCPDDNLSLYIKNLKDFSYFRNIIAICKDNEEIVETLNIFINYVYEYICNQPIIDDNIYFVFDNMLEYYPYENNDDLCHSIEKIADVLLNKKEYDKAISYYSKYIDLNGKSNIYWKRMMALLNCSNEEELISQDVDFKESEDFKKAINFTENIDYYFDIVDKWRNEQERKAQEQEQREQECKAQMAQELARQREQERNKIIESEKEKRKKKYIVLLTIILLLGVVLISVFFLVFYPMIVFKVESGIKYKKKGDNPYYYLVNLEEKNRSVIINQSCVEITKNVFNGNKNIVELTIPKSVKKIGENSFKNCTNMSYIYYEGTISDWCDINFVNEYSNPSSQNVDFYVYDNNGIVEYNNKTYSILSDINLSNCTNKNINEFSFYGFKNIISLIVGDSFENIGNNAFANCNNLKSVMITDNLKKIGSNVFKNCSSLESIILPFIGEVSLNFSSKDYWNYHKQFYHIFGIEDDIPKSLKKIEITNDERVFSKAFYGCKNVTEIVISNTVSEIDEGAFYGCSSLNSITLPFVGRFRRTIEDTGHDLQFGYIFGHEFYDNTFVVIQDDIRGFSTSYYIPNTLSKVVISDSEYIPDGAFKGFKNLQDISITSEVTFIGDFAFYNCEKLKYIQLPSSLRHLGECAFYKCADLTEIVIPTELTAINKKSFYGCEKLSGILNLKKISSISTGAFQDCQNITTIIIPNTVTFIGLDAFRNVKADIIWEENATITDIGSGFSNYKGISLVVPENVKGITMKAFYNCNNLGEIYLPSTISYINEAAFSGCISLETIYFNGTSSEWKSIKKSSKWNSDSAIKKIVCSDETIYI